MKSKKQQPVYVICYDKMEKFPSRANAKKKFVEAMMGSDGAEQDRYTQIFLELEGGHRIATDIDYYCWELRHKGLVFPEDDNGRAKLFSINLEEA